MSTTHGILLWISILLSQAYGLQRCGGITFDRRNFTIITLKTHRYSFKVPECITDLKKDRIFQGEANMWTIEKNDPWLYFDVAEKNATTWYCTPLMRYTSPTCTTKFYRTDRSNVIVFDDNSQIQLKNFGTPTDDFSEYLHSGCDNQDKMEEYFSKCLRDKELSAEDSYNHENKTEEIIIETSNVANVTKTNNGNNNRIIKNLILWSTSFIPILFIL